MDLRGASEGSGSPTGARDDDRLVALMPDVGDPKPERPNQREHARQPIELEVEYTRLNSFFSDYTRNISKGGTFIRTAKPLEVGTEFMFKLRVPKVGQPLELLGRVQWVVLPEDVLSGHDRGTGEPGMGIRFIYKDGEERARLEQMVERVMVDSLGQLLYSKLMDQSRQDAEGAGPPASPDVGKDPRKQS